MRRASGCVWVQLLLQDADLLEEQSLNRPNEDDRVKKRKAETHRNIVELKTQDTADGPMMLPVERLARRAGSQAVHGRSSGTVLL